MHRLNYSVLNPEVAHKRHVKRRNIGIRCMAASFQIYVYAEAEVRCLSSECNASTGWPQGPIERRNKTQSPEHFQRATAFA